MSIIVVHMNWNHNDGYKKGLVPVNGFRVARKYIEQLSDEDLQALWELSKDDIEYEAVVVTHLMECEMEERKEKRMKEIMKELRTLGVGGIVTTYQINFDRYTVYVDAEYFGIWDTNSKTFID